MTDAAKVAALRELSERATPGPWTLCPDLLGCGCGHGTQSIDARDGNTLVAEFRDLTNPPDESDSNNTEPIETRRTNAALIVALVNAYRDGLLVPASDSGEVAEGSGATDHHFGLQMSTMGIGRGFDQRRAQQAFPHGDPRHLHYLDEWDAALTRPVPETPRCPTCDHLMSMHRDEFGCEHEFCLSDDKTETLCGEYGPLETPEAAPSSETLR